MQKITIIAFLFFSVSLQAQLLLDVCGDGWIRERLIVGNTTDRNLFIGHETGAQNSGDLNTFVGNFAGSKNTSGRSNTFFGSGAGENNTAGVNNTFLGLNTGKYNVTGSFNVYVGDGAGFYNLGQQNTVVGQLAGFSSLSSEYDFCTFVGQRAGEVNIGNLSTFIGTQSGNKNTTGYHNTFIGAGSGRKNVDGYNNTLIGSFTEVASPNLTNASAIGHQAEVDANNKIVIGNSSITTIGGYANWSNLSDKRYKQNVKAEQNHLTFILNLEPVSYNLNTTKLVKEQIQKRATLQQKLTHTKNESYPKVNTNDAIIDAQQKDKIRYSGFIAQDVEKAARKAGYEEFSGIVKPKINGGKYALRYAEFVVPLVGAVQEQQTLIEAQQAQINERDDRISQLEEDVAELKTMLEKVLEGKTTKSIQSTTIESARLGQNLPNPFNTSTQIPYTIPTSAQKANMLIHSINGQLIKTIAIKSFGEGMLELQTTGLSKGQYTYSLEVDGRLVETKQMQLVR